MSGVTHDLPVSGPHQPVSEGTNSGIACLPPAIIVQNLVKEYPLETGSQRVLDDISFKVRPGERLAILGRNGAGKSTLIRILAGIEPPTHGFVARGISMSWPLALGGGFEFNMTGYDNVRFIADVYDIPFAETFAFVQHFTEMGSMLFEPMRVYSSGMRMRVALALSLALDFDCFLVDEVLFVGDVRFQQKCYEAIFEARKDRAMILAIHSADVVRRHCTSALVLRNGRGRVFDDVELATDIYMDALIEAMDDAMEALEADGQAEVAAHSPVAEIAVIAMPGALGWWLMERINAAAAAGGRVPRIATVGMLDETFSGPAHDIETVIYYAHAPSQAFLQRLQARDIPTLLVITSAMDTVAELVGGGRSPPIAVREVSASACVLDRYARAGGFPVRSIINPAMADEVIATAAELTGLAPAAFAAGMPAGESDAVPVDDAIRRDSGRDRTQLVAAASIDERTTRHVELALVPIIDSLLPGGTRTTITWPYDVFFSGDNLGQPAPLLADVTGPARVLIYGPYLHLPDGKWLMRGTFGFSEHVRDLSFMFELLRTHHVISAGWIKPRYQGLFKVEMPVTLDIAEHPVEVRLHSKTGAIEGRVGMAAVEFIPVP